MQGVIWSESACFVRSDRRTSRHLIGASLGNFIPYLGQSRKRPGEVWKGLPYQSRPKPGNPGARYGLLGQFLHPQRLVGLKTECAANGRFRPRIPKHGVGEFHQHPSDMTRHLGDMLETERCCLPALIIVGFPNRAQARMRNPQDFATRHLIGGSFPWLFVVQHSTTHAPCASHTSAPKLSSCCGSAEASSRKVS